MKYFQTNDINILILTEGGKKNGYGHITRCLSLYQAFRKKGVGLELVVNADVSVKNLFKDENYTLLDWINGKGKLLNHINRSDVVIVDSYLADPEFYKKVSDTVRLPVYFDDDKRIDYPRGVVLNGAIHAESMGYPEKKGIVYILGSRFIPIREAFWDVPKKKVRKEVENILITLGGNDLRSLTADILRYLIEKYPNIKKKVIVADAFQNKSKLDKLAGENVELIHNPCVDDLKKEMFDADIAISAGGQTLYELARMGVPTIAIGVADNQKQNLKGWENAGFIENIGFWNDKGLIEVFQGAIEMLKEQKIRESRSINGMSLVSGRGSCLVVDKLLGMIGGFDQNENIRLLKVKEEDARILWEWRNHPEIRKRCFNQDPVSWEEHQKWFSKKIKDKKTSIYMAFLGDDKIGVIRFEDEGKNIVVSVNLDPDYFGRGLGSAVIKLGTRMLEEEGRLNKAIIANIKLDNIASQKSFIKAGYRILETKTSELVYKYSLS